MDELIATIDARGWYAAVSGGVTGYAHVSLYSCRDLYGRHLAGAGSTQGQEAALRKAVARAEARFPARA
jgi:hypothetical protein